jgi:hypothetical protein
MRPIITKLSRMPMGPRRGLIAAVVAALALPSGTASALWTSATYSGNLYEMSGGEKVSYLSVSGQSSDWFSCTAYNCVSTPGYVSVSWSISDGSSTFHKIFGRYLGQASCNERSVVAYVYAGPSYPSGSHTSYFPSGPACQIGYYVSWQWYAGMCDTNSDCYWNKSRGPHIGWNWSPPSTSAFSFGYFW